MPELKVLKPTDNIMDAIEEGGLLWDVHEEQMMTSSMTDVPKHKAIVRDDTGDVIGVVGKSRYKTISNAECFTKFDQIVKERGAIYTRSGVFDNGGKVAIEAKIDQRFELPNGDITDMYLTMVNTHDGSGSLMMMETPIRLWCSNILSTAINSAVAKASIRHTSGAALQLNAIDSIFQTSIVNFDTFYANAIEMHKTIVDKNAVDSFLKSVFPVKAGKDGEPSEITIANTMKKRGFVEGLFHEGQGNTGTTMWELYNSVTEYATHHMGGGGDVDRYKRNLFGSAKTLRDLAYKSATGSMSLC